MADNAQTSGYVQIFLDNPLADFAELPKEYKDLKFSTLLCGVIRGALEMVCSPVFNLCVSKLISFFLVSNR